MCSTIYASDQFFYAVRRGAAYICIGFRKRRIMLYEYYKEALHKSNRNLDYLTNTLAYDVIDASDNLLNLSLRIQGDIVA